MKIVTCINFDESTGSNLIDAGSLFQVIYVNNLSKVCAPLGVSALVVNLRKFDINILKTLIPFKKIYPSLEIIISSKQYIELLSFWCLRNQILDYVILPNELEYLKKTLISLNKISISSEQEVRSPIKHKRDILEISQPDISNLKTKNAIKYIGSNYAKKIRLKTLATECNYSVSAFSVMFKKECGISSTEYINAYRISVAKKMLSETMMSVSSIAYRCGFEDVSYFVKVFKAIQNVTPTNYRKRIQ